MTILQECSPYGCDKSSVEGTIREAQKKATLPHTCKEEKKETHHNLYIFTFVTSKLDGHIQLVIGEKS